MYSFLFGDLDTFVFVNATFKGPHRYRFLHDPIRVRVRSVEYSADIGYI